MLPSKVPTFETTLNSILDNDIFELETSLREIPDVLEQTDEYGNTLAIITARDGNTRMLAVMINANPKVLEQDNKGKTPAIYAAKRGHTETLAMMINANPKVLEQTDNKDKTPVIYAATRGHTETLAMMINANPMVLGQLKFIYKKISHKKIKYLLEAYRIEDMDETEVPSVAEINITLNNIQHWISTGNWPEIMALEKDDRTENPEALLQSQLDAVHQKISTLNNICMCDNAFPWLWDEYYYIHLQLLLKSSIVAITKKAVSAIADCISLNNAEIQYKIGALLFDFAVELKNKNYQDSRFYYLTASDHFRSSGNIKLFYQLLLGKTLLSLEQYEVMITDLVNYIFPLLPHLKDWHLASNLSVTSFAKLVELFSLEPPKEPIFYKAELAIMLDELEDRFEAIIWEKQFDDEEITNIFKDWVRCLANLLNLIISPSLSPAKGLSDLESHLTETEDLNLSEGSSNKSEALSYYLITELMVTTNATDEFMQELPHNSEGTENITNETENSEEITSTIEKTKSPSRSKGSLFCGGSEVDNKASIRRTNDTSVSRGHSF